MAINPVFDHEANVPRGQFTQEEFSRTARALAASKKKRAAPAVSSQAEVSAENLVANPYWKTYQQQIQAKIEEAGAEIAELKDRVSDPGMLDYEQILADKMKIAVLGGKKQAWEEAVALPKDIMDAAD